MSQRCGFIREKSNRPERSTIDGDGGAQKQPKGGGGEGAQGKAFEHFVNGDEQSAKAEADEHALRRAVDQVRPQLADGVAAHDAQEQERNPDDFQGAHNGGGLEFFGPLAPRGVGWGRFGFPQRPPDPVLVESLPEAGVLTGQVVDVAEGGGEIGFHGFVL